MSKSLRFTPYAYAKLSFLRDYGDTEIAGFAMCQTDDPLLVTDFYMPHQDCTAVTVELDGASLLAYRAMCREQGLDEKHSFRIWVHTHPKISADPSSTDEDTFSELFDRTDWGIMAILSKTEDRYVRVRYGGDGPTANAELKWEIDYKADFPASDIEAWVAEYELAVTIVKDWSAPTKKSKETTFRDMTVGEKVRENDDKWRELAKGWPEDSWEPDKPLQEVEILQCAECNHDFEGCESVDPYSTVYCPECFSDNLITIDTYYAKL